MEQFLDESQQVAEWSVDPSDPLVELESAVGTGALSPALYLSAGSITTPSAATAEAASPENLGQPDEFTLNQSYQSYREDLRGLIFHAAQSTAPTREGTPAIANENEQFYNKGGADANLRRRETASILHAGNRSVYLKNYLSSIAPWVSNSYAPYQSSLIVLMLL